MDPDEMLTQVRAVCARVLDGHDVGADPAECILLLTTLAGDARDLDTWLTAGGFLPADWRHQRTN